ncbi:hypothetical protein [Cohnella caldifontis]|uniref:Ger(x)C family spore germination protein n=1 Tax=Cohnella caldifontis TaxID=3027471 RepID=UPI0023ED6999|nr:hypothetical protein [Cohnella sp. YIM B05605]
MINVARRLLLLAALSLLALPIAGCWDVKTIQDIVYLTGVGVDYSNGKYQLYVQTLDFSNVAKSEGGKSDKPGAIYIGRAEHETLDGAVDRIYQSAQQPVFWGHVAAIVLSENVMKEK